MGAGNPYGTYAKCIGKDDKWGSFMKKYDLGNKEGKKFFTVFKRMDKKNKGALSYCKAGGLLYSPLFSY
jgi:hypothetical protein